MFGLALGLSENPPRVGRQPRGKVNNSGNGQKMAGLALGLYENPTRVGRLPQATSQQLW